MAPIVSVIETVLQRMTRLVRPSDISSIMGIDLIDMAIFDVQSDRKLLTVIRDFKSRFPLVPTVALVPYADIEMVERVLEQGVEDYISQPIPIERLKTTLRNVIRLRQLISNHHNAESSAMLDYVGERVAPRLSFFDKSGRLKTLRAIEDEAIEHAVTACNECITQAARALGVGRSTLYRKMQEKNRLTDQISRENQTTRPIIAASSMIDS